MTTAQTIIFIAFSVVNACRLLAYLPQIAVLLRKGDTSAISCVTWHLFLVSNATTAIYAAYVISDQAMALLFLANTLCCVTIVGLVHHKRRNGRQGG